MSLAALTIRYEQLAPRDQRILRFGAVAVAILLLLLVLLPLQRNLTQGRDHLRQQQEDFDWMGKQAPVLVAAGPGTAASAAGTRDSLVVLIDRSARESGLGKTLTGSQPVGNGAMRVQFANADFNLFLGWLHRLTTQQGLRVEDASVTASGGAGLVNASVQLRPGA